MQHQLWLRKHADDVHLAIRRFPPLAAFVLAVLLDSPFEESYDLWMRDTRRGRRQAASKAEIFATKLWLPTNEHPEVAAKRISDKSQSLNETVEDLRATLRRYESVITQLPGIRASVESLTSSIENLSEMASGNARPHLMPVEHWLGFEVMSCALHAIELCELCSDVLNTAGRLRD